MKHRYRELLLIWPTALFASCATQGDSEPDTTSESFVYEGVEVLFPGAIGEVRTETFITPHGPQELTYQLIHGFGILEGDIVLFTPDQQSEIYTGAPLLLGEKWPDRQIPYNIDASFPGEVKEKIERAIASWEKYGIIKFVPVSGSLPQADTAHFQNFKCEESRECYCGSQLGKAPANGPRQPTFVLIHESCTEGSITHEIGHLIGLGHEHSRSDRDEYVQVNDSNIPSDALACGPYDFESIMHYGSCFESRERVCARDTPDAHTIIRKDSEDPWIEANRIAPSPNDIQTVRAIYGKPWLTIPAVYNWVQPG